MSYGQPWNEQRLTRVRLVKELFEVVRELHDEFAAERRKFTPDGHLVGSIGEVIAAYAFDLTLLRSSNPVHDAEAPDGTIVQIKLTGGKSIGLYSEPKHLIVLQMRGAKFTTVYNGPGSIVWSHCGKPQKNGQRSVRVKTLCELDGTAFPKIPQVRDMPF